MPQGRSYSKRGRSESGDKMSSIDEFKERIEKKADLSIQDVATMLLAMHEANVDKQDKILNSTTEMAEKMKETTKRIDNHEKRIINLEMKALSANLIMKGIQVHKKAQEDNKAESWNQTKEQVEEAIKSLGVKDEVAVISCRRFRGDAQKNEPIQVILGNPLQKRLLFNAVAQVKPNFSLDHEYPVALRSELQELRAKAHEMRKATCFTSKFRVEVRGGLHMIGQKNKADTRDSPV